MKRNKFFATYKLQCMIIVMISIMLVLPAQIVAAEKDEINSLEDGAWAFQICFRDGFSNNLYPGFVAGFKHHFADKKAFRISAGFSYNSRSIDAGDFYDYGLGFNSSGYEADHYIFDITTHYLHYFSNQKTLNLYAGLGPLICYEDYEATDSVYSVENLKSHLWRTGISCLIGLEWFARDNVSFIAETSFSATYAWESSDNFLWEGFEIINYDQESRKFDFGNILLNFGLSYYW